MDSLHSPGQLSRENKVILLIEDNVDDERLTLRSLRRNNVMNEVIVTCDGQEALDYLFGKGNFEGRDMSVMPSVVILDLKLPKVSGLDVLKSIRESEMTMKIPVVVLTSTEDPTQVVRSYELGANSFVRKPQDPTEYAETILNVAMYWLLLNRITPEPLHA